MRGIIAKFFGVLGLFVLALAVSAPAEAGSRFFFGFGFPIWGWGAPYYYPYYPYYAPRPVYYVPPPVYVAPEPVYYSSYDAFFNRPVYTPPARTAPRVNCRRFEGDGIDDDTGQPFYGVACMQVDGKWHIVERY